MRKFYFLCLILLASGSKYSAQNYVQLGNQVGSDIYVTFNFSEFQIENDGVYTTVKIPGSTPMLKAGAPELQKVTTALIVDDLREMEVEVIHADFTEYSDIYMLPSKGNLLRTVDPATLPYNEGPVYSTNDFFPGVLASLGRAFVQHQFRGQPLHFNPVQYNPVTHKLRLYTNIEVMVKPTELAGENQLPANVAQITNATFREVYNSRFLNYSEHNNRYEQVSEIGNMLVITDAEYLEELEPWIQWKKEKGIDVEVVDVATINSINAISNYVADYYNENGLTYLMLVGDEDQIPVQLVNNSGGQGYCDVCYGYINGNDSYTEVFVGHFLVHNDSELPAVIAKTLEYEKNPNTQIDWFSTAMGIGSDEGEGYGDDDEADWQHQNGIKEDLLDFTYEEVWEMYAGSQASSSPTGGVTADQGGEPAASTIADIIEGGCSLINYTGHGAHSLIATGSFTNNNINALNNNKFYPYFIIVGCCVGDYDDDDGSGDTFGEAWLKSPSATTLTGGIGGSFGSVYQSWAPPMEAQDEMNKIIANLAGINTRHTVASIHYHGCASMNDEYGTAGDDMTDTWIVMADPTVQLRTAMPVQIVANHPATAFFGVNQISIQCNMDDAMICLTIDGEIIATGLVSGGQCVLNFDAISTDAVILVTATSFNTIPYQGTIELIPASGPFLVGSLTGINDFSGNNNGQADFNEQVSIDAEAENIGIETANDVIAVVTCDNPFIVVDDNSFTFGDIPAGGVVEGDGAFSFHVNGAIEDMTPVVFVVTYTDSDGNTWTSEITVVIHAPSYQCTTTYTIDDAAGNDDGQLDSGETVIISFPVTNSGSASSATEVYAWLASNSNFVSVVASPVILGQMQPGQTMMATFEVVVSSDAPQMEPVAFSFTSGADNYASVCSYARTINLMMETWESGDDSMFPWTYSGSAEWYVTDQSPFEGDYCMRSGQIANSQQTTMNLNMTFDQTTDLSFMYKVSSEESYDFLRFYVGTQMQEEWSGSIGWTEATYSLNAGTYNLRWTYEKDPFVVAGQDAAWVDNIMFNPEQVVGSDEMRINSMYSIYPNPAEDFLQIDFSTGKSEYADLVVTNTLGAVILRQHVGQLLPGLNQFRIETESWSSGLYHITFNTASGVTTEVVMVR
jgi:hypothetical protein